MSDRNKRLLLIDGSALAYQSFYALGNLSSRRGTPTGAVYGFYTTVDTLIEDYKPDFMAVVMDEGEPEDRIKAYSAYKADRPPTPPDLLLQFPLIEEVMTTLGIPVLSKLGVEADDIIATLAEMAQTSQPPMEVFIFSPDKDILQIVNDSIRVIRRHGSKTKVYDAAAVVERYGCSPEQLPDLLGLMGDSVDNIPGVPGIGEKTAAVLLKEHGTLEAVLKNASSITKPKLRECLQQNADQAILSKELAVLKKDVDLQTRPEDLLIAPPNWSKAYELFRELNFRRAAEKAASHLSAPSGNDGLFSFMEPEVKPSAPFEYSIVDSSSKLDDLVSRLIGEDLIAVDTETTSLDTESALLVGICIGIKGRVGYYLPVGHHSGTNLSLAEIQQKLGPLFASPHPQKVGQNIKYDQRILTRHGLPVRGWIGDTSVLAHLLHTSIETTKLDYLCEMFLGWQKIPTTQLIGTHKSSQISMAQVAVEKVAEYGVEDAVVTYELHKKLEPELDEVGIRRWYETVEVPLNLVLMDMESQGVTVDPDILKRQSKEVAQIIWNIEEELYTLAGMSFNLNSPSQLAHVLYDVRGIPRGKDRSTRQDVLENLARSGEPMAEKIIEYRQLAKLKSTYLDALPGLISSLDGRIHTSYRSNLTNTGRISSSNPNLQNIPIRSDFGRRVREAFIAARGRTFVAADYSQIELRVLAHCSQDPGFARAFNEGLDIHTVTAAEIFEIDPADVDKNMRRKAKEINFGLNYGMTAFGLAQRLAISRSEATTYMNRYFSRYPNIQKYFDQVLEDADRNGYVTTLSGRRIEIKRPVTRGSAEARMAINYPIQGSAADILKKAMVEMANVINEQHLDASMVLTVHDEIILEVADSQVDDVARWLSKVMTGTWQLSVPLEVDVRIGKSWAELG